MISDNFSIFRTNCAMLTSYIRHIFSSHASWVLACMLSRCMIKNEESCEILLRIFHSDGREEEPGLFCALLFSELMEKVSFFMVENFFNFAI